MKKHLKFLLGLALIVLIFGGCQNPSGPETPEVNEPPVVETPEDNSNKTKVEFKYYPNKIGTGHSVTFGNKLFFDTCIRYFLDLRPRSLDDCDYDYSYNYKYVYEYPENYDDKLLDDVELLKKSFEDAFEKVFGTKYYEEGTTIDLTQWTSEALDLVDSYEEGITCTKLYFLAEDTGINYKNIEAKSFDSIEVGNQDIVVYVFLDWKFIDIY